MKSKKEYKPFTIEEEKKYLQDLDNIYLGKSKGSDIYLRALRTKRYKSGDVESKILVRCLYCKKEREVTFKDWKLQLQHLSKCPCSKVEVPKDTNTYIYRDYISDRYIYKGKGKISKGIQYIWVRCRECGAIIEVDGSKYLKGEIFKNCYCFHPTPVKEITLDRFIISKGFVKYSEDKIGSVIGTDLLLGEGNEKYSVLVKCLLCGRKREVSAEEFFNERTNNYKHCICEHFKKDYGIGSRFGHLTLYSIDDDYYYFKCDCGNFIKYEKTYFEKRNLSTCGKNCKLNKYTSKYTDVSFVGKQFNNFKVLNILQRETFFNEKLLLGTYWYCLCLKCGRKDIYYAKEIYEGIKKSCKCESMKYSMDYQPLDIVNGILINDIFIIPNKGTLWQCICPACGDFFVRDPNSIVSGHCGNCGCTTISKGEVAVLNALQKIASQFDISYYREFKFKDLKYKDYLKYDFEVEGNNKIVLIEYDGKQHYVPQIPHVKDKEKAEKIFKEIQERDKLKNEYALKQNIPLLRIKYNLKMDEIEEQVYIFLKKEGVI